MGAKSRIISGAILCAAALGMAIGAPRGASQLAQSAEEAVPAFHNEPPQGQLPETLSPSQFTDVVVQNAYTLAARVKKTLYGIERGEWQQVDMSKYQTPVAAK